MNEWKTIKTDLLDVFNDCVEIYFRKNKDNSITYSDDSHTIFNVELCGIFFSDNEHKNFLNKILKKYGVMISEKELFTIQNNINANAKNNLLSAIQEINTMCQKHTEDLMIL